MVEKERLDQSLKQIDQVCYAMYAASRFDIFVRGMSGSNYAARMDLRRFEAGS